MNILSMQLLFLFVVLATMQVQCDDRQSKGAKGMMSDKGAKKGMDKKGDSKGMMMSSKGDGDTNRTNCAEVQPFGWCCQS